MNRREIIGTGTAAIAYASFGFGVAKGNEIPASEIPSPHQFVMMANWAPALEALLLHRGVKIVGMENIIGGQKIGVKSGFGTHWKQMHVDAIWPSPMGERIERLADAIEAHSNVICFSRLWLPKQRDQHFEASYMDHGNVSLRVITSYVPPTGGNDPYGDKIVSRFDVLFCDAAQTLT